MTSRDDQHDDGKPAYGYGAGGRPLHSVNDRAAEQLRELLRRAGCAEFGEVDGGFVVEHPGVGPMLLVHTGQSRAAAEQEYARRARDVVRRHGRVRPVAGQRRIRPRWLGPARWR